MAKRVRVEYQPKNGDEPKVEFIKAETWLTDGNFIHLIDSSSGEICPALTLHHDVVASLRMVNINSKVQRILDQEEKLNGRSV